MQRSFIAGQAYAPAKRKLRKVPFVELYAGRLQGVVSSGSDIERVYVSWIEAKSGDYYCSTNNNRPCGGLRGGPCKHIQALVDNGVAQYGEAKLTSFLGVRCGPNAWEIVSELGGTLRKEGSGEVFSRFLDYLRYVDLGANADILPEMAWFVGG